MDTVVVVGAGVAGWRSAHELRAQGFAGRVVVVGEEPHPPYDRPPLSKEVLRGEDDPVLAPALPDDVEHRRGARAVGLDPAARLVHLADGEPLRYDGLVLACGAGPRLPAAWRGVPGVTTLRTWDDALRLRAALRPGARVLVVGAGWIGAEVATAAVAAGARVTAVDPLCAPLAGALPVEVAAATVTWWRDAGVDLRLGRAVTSLAADGDGVRARLDDGGEVAADVVVVGIGVRPATAWLAGALDVDDAGGVLVDGRLRASAPDVVAAGDAAARWSGLQGRHVVAEHWQEAMDAPVTAVRSLLGGDGPPHDPVPWVWSRQWGRMLTWAGIRRPGERVVWRGAAGFAGGGLAWLVHDDGDAARLHGVLAVDRPRESAAARRLLDRSPAPGPRIDVVALADPDVPVTDAVLPEPSG